MLVQILSIVQLVLSVILIILVLLQQQDSGLGVAFGGTGGGVKLTRRGPEKMVFLATVVVSIIFFSISLAIVIL
jgi:protein translocase SecG subunit